MIIGKKINAARLREGLTIRDLAEKTGLSIGFISNLERDQTSPTLSNLEIICPPLKINLLDLIAEATESDRVVVTRREAREEIYRERDDEIHEELNEYHKVDAMVLTMRKASEFGEAKWKHHKDEVGVVIEGELEIRVDDEIINLKKGDSIYISRHVRHSHRNPKDEISVSHWFAV